MISFKVKENLLLMEHITEKVASASRTAGSVACDAVRILSLCVFSVFLTHVGLVFSKYRQVFSIWQGTWPLSSLNSLPRDSLITKERYDFCSLKPEICWSRSLPGSCVYPRPISVARQLGNIIDSPWFTCPLLWLRAQNLLREEVE